MAVLEKRKSFGNPSYPPYQYVIIECHSEEVYSLERFKISGLSKPQLDMLQNQFDLDKVGDQNMCSHPNVNLRYGAVVPVTTVLNFLSREFGFYLKGSAIMQRHGSSFKERYILERNG